MARGGRRQADRRRVPGLSGALAAYCATFAGRWDSESHRDLATAYAAGDEVPTEGTVIWRAMFSAVRPALYSEWVYDRRIWMVVGDLATLAEA